MDAYHDHNNSPIFPRGVFAGLEKLRVISVSDSPLLSTIEPGAFAGLPLIENISLDSLPRVIKGNFDDGILAITPFMATFFLTSCLQLTELPVGLVLEGSRPLSLTATGSSIRWIDPGVYLYLYFSLCLSVFQWCLSAFLLAPSGALIVTVVYIIDPRRRRQQQRPLLENFEHFCQYI